MLTIVAVGLYQPGTGFTRVLSSLFEELKLDFNIHWVGIGYKGQSLDLGYKVYPCNLKGGDMYGAFQARSLVDQNNADIVLFLNDFWMLKNYNVTFKDSMPKCIKCAYVPLDGGITSMDQMGDISMLDQLVVYTDFAKNEVVNCFNSSNLTAPNIHVIPHGTDTSAFAPLEDLNRQEILKREEIKTTSFVVLNANRFSQRKDLKCTLDGFAKFYYENEPDAYLCLHQPGIIPEKKEELMEEIKVLGIENQVILNPFGDGNYISDQELNELYNACDVGINTSLGEGWGMISFEHGACKKPQILPSHTACKELWKDASPLLQISESIYLTNNPFEMYKSHPDFVCKSIELLYNDSEKYEYYAQRAFENSKAPKFDWRNVAKEWKDVLLTSIQD